MITQILLIVFGIIIAAALSSIVAVILRRNRQAFLSQWLDFKVKAKKKITEEQRLGELEHAMDKLFKEHQEIEKIDELFPKISNYISCKGLDEYNYCKTYLQKRYAKGFRRYA